VSAPDPQASSYGAIIERIFGDRYRPGAKSLSFHRDDLATAAERLGVDTPRNLGDVVYAFRHRRALPDAIVATQPEGQEWVIEGTGISNYAFRLVPISRVVPNPALITTKIPDATPEIVSAYALSDEQALLAKVRYNRLIDVFLGIVAYSLQSHLRTTVADVGQIEIDEIYVGLDRHGRQYVVPVQAKGGSDQIGVVQTKQDILCCREKFPSLICRAVSSQFMADDVIAMFELRLEDEAVKIAEERHYRLVPSDAVTPADLRTSAACST